MRTLASIVTMALVAGPAAGAVVFSEDFNSGTLGSFTYADYMTDGSAFEWSTNGDAGLANFTDGDGSAATSNSDQEVGAYDHAIVSPLFQLNGGKTTLTMRTNYQNFANFDFADLDVTTDDGATWTTIPLPGPVCAIALSDDGRTSAAVPRTTDFFRSEDGARTWPGP